MADAIAYFWNARVALEGEWSSEIARFVESVPGIALDVVDGFARGVRPPACGFGVLAQQREAGVERAGSLGEPLGHLPSMGVRRATKDLGLPQCVSGLAQNPVDPL